MGLGTLIKPKMENPLFCLKQVPHRLDFMHLLPLDWQEPLKAEGIGLDQKSQILGLYIRTELIGGGMVFKGLPTAATDFEKSHAAHLFKSIGNYIGFVWVRAEYRGMKLGSAWFLELFKRHPTKGFWLAIEDQNLVSFYTQLGFKSHALHSLHGVFQEQILVYQP